MDRLSSLDVSFLTNESSSSHMHVGGICIFEGPPMAYDDLLDHIQSRLHLVPRFRQKLAYPPVPTGRPFWIDDSAFNLEYHVRHSALPAPGSEEQLRNMAARVFSQALDRTKPLWELWMVQGLTRKRFAFLTKTHHALVDGVSGVDIATVLFDVKPVPEPAQSDHDWVPEPRALGRPAARQGRRGPAAGRPCDCCGGSSRRSSIRAPPSTRSPRRPRRSARSAGTSPTRRPSVPLNVEIGSHRRFEWVRADLAQFKRIKSALGGTVNDVVLAVVSGALRSWLHSRGVRTEGLELRAQVPVSIRAADERGQLGNKIVARARADARSTSRTRSSGSRPARRRWRGSRSRSRRSGAEVISRFNDFAPPTLLAQAARVNFSTRLFNLVVTNVPGPQIPLYVLGRELEDIFPVGFLPPNQALFVAIMSYNGGINFGLLADYDAIDDVAEIGAGIEVAIAELLEAAEAAERAGTAPREHRGRRAPRGL